MFGRLKINDIPYNEPIIVFTFVFIIIASLTIVFVISYFGKWKYLWNNWLTSLDHKKIGIMYIIISMVMLLRGFVDAVMMRTQQMLASSNIQKGFLSPHHYDQIVTVHGVIMIIFMATPFIIGLMNIIIPLQIGSRDLAFPMLNSLSFWLFMVGVILINLSLGIGEFAQTGWTAYPPLSEKTYSPGVGVDYWIWSMQISGISTTITGINFIVTILFMRVPNMNIMNMPVFTWTTLCTNILIVIAFPILTVTIMLLTLDRYLGMHFFTQDMGGNPMMYINLFWSWGHPEVYILVLPIFGIFSEVVATFSQKSLFNYKTLIFTTIIITLLAFCVWLHHFFTMGAGSNVNSFFGIMTMVIAIPTGVKIFNWLFTMYRGRIIINSIMLWTIGFIITFVIGGAAGVLLALPTANYVLHNSLFVVAHFHNVIIGGVLFGCFAGATYWFPKIFGFTLNETWGKVAFFFWIIGFYTAFMPLYVLGFMGMTRRLNQSIDLDFHNLLTISFVGVLIIMLGILSQIVQVVISIINKKSNIDYSGDPWNGRTLEWFTSSPPPVYNFAIIPKIEDTIDAFWIIKKNISTDAKLKKYQSIFLPKNTSFSILIAIFALLFCFSMIWYIWWLSIISMIGIIIVTILYNIKSKEYYYFSTNKIRIIENNRYIRE
ncbi:MAG: cytochrome o ubiquinol oxidase subunit I [Candidatus Lightella neohaematopini]|nr:cytochrome o ubiquinol oxidase subunit I [Candidatus Lightella neohaematopini]